jgi:hypothetical protein
MKKQTAPDQPHMLRQVSHEPHSRNKFLEFKERGICLKQHQQLDHHTEFL